MKKLYFLCLLLAGCATEGKYRTHIYSLIGMPEAELVFSNGVPDSTYELDGTKYLVYNYSQVVSTQGYTTPTGQTVHGQTRHRRCRTVFSIEDGFVSDVKYEGNFCKRK